MFVQSGPFTECISCGKTVSSCCGVCVHNSLKIFYLPGLKQHSIYFSDILSILCVFDFCVFSIFLLTSVQNWLYKHDFNRDEKRVKIGSFENIPTIFILKIRIENVRYSIYSRMTIYIYYRIAIGYIYKILLQWNNRQSLSKNRKKLSKPGVHILLPRLRPQHVWPGNKFGKTEFSLYLTTRHRLMPQNHSICFLQMEVSPKMVVPPNHQF
jgi:hypothetical protein